MPALWPAGPWRFEAAVTITECNEQSVTNWLQFARIADSARNLVCQPKHTGEDRSSIPALGWCRMIGGLWVGVILSEHHARAA